jgi:hypothetical protein
MSTPTLEDPPALLPASTSTRSTRSPSGDRGQSDAASIIIVNGINGENKDALNHHSQSKEHRDKEDLKPTAKRSKTAPSTPGDRGQSDAASIIIINGINGENKDAMNHHSQSKEHRDKEDLKPTAKRSKTAPSTPEALVDYIGQRVAKLFPGYSKAPFFGYITSQTEEEEETLWTVQYDDGDQEELNEQEVQEGINLSSKKQNQELKLLDIYHLDGPLHLQSKNLPKTIKKASKTVIKFFLFLLERQRCWERRQVAKDHPLDWTSSHVFRNYFFCNNYRELDRGTSFFRSQMLEKLESIKPQTLLEWIETVLWASYCYRLGNRSDSFSNLGGDYECATNKFNGIPSRDEWPSFSKLVTKAQQEGHTFFTGAHQTCGFVSYMLWMKEACAKKGKLVKRTAQQIYECAQESDLEGCFQAISNGGLKGVGDFFSWQITCDLMESRCLPKCDSTDFCALGPGAKGKVCVILVAGTNE